MHFVYKISYALKGLTWGTCINYAIYNSRKTRRKIIMRHWPEVLWKTQVMQQEISFFFLTSNRQLSLIFPFFRLLNAQYNTCIGQCINYEFSWRIICLFIYWFLLRYGGGPTLPRKAINTGLSQSDLAIEVYPLRLQLYLVPRGERAIIRISKKVYTTNYYY